MPKVTATALKNSTAEVLDQVQMGNVFAVTRHDKPRAVLVSMERYEQMMAGGGNEVWLEDLYQEYRGMLDRMQEPEQRAAAERAFNATSEELGAAAVRSAMRTRKLS